MNYPGFGQTLSPGEVDTLFVRFAPTTMVSAPDTLFLASNAVNHPLIKIKLTGTCIQVPPLEPANLSVGMNDNSVTLSWDAVTHTIFNTPIIPDYNFVYNSDDPYGRYLLLGMTPNLTYANSLVGIGAQRMYYKITAVKFYRDDLSPADLDDWLRQRLVPGMNEEEILQILSAYSPNVDAPWDEGIMDFSGTYRFRLRGRVSQIWHAALHIEVLSALETGDDSKLVQRFELLGDFYLDTLSRSCFCATKVFLSILGENDEKSNRFYALFYNAFIGYRIDRANP